MSSAPPNENIQKIDTHAVIFGGGIAGLWCLNVLRKLGLEAILIEHKAIGGTQTLASQGMIHGGQRYGLQGKENPHLFMLKDLPEVWNRALAGKGVLDLRKVEVLAKGQHMWSPGALTSNVAAFFASKVMQSEVQKLKRSAWPEGLSNNCGRLGSVYQLNEVVLDSRSLVSELFEPHKENCVQGEALDFVIEEDSTGEKRVKSVLVKSGDQLLEFRAEMFIAAAGEGNETLRDLIGAKQVLTQRRPLKQILVKGAPFDLYAHCITTDPRPRATITTHRDSAGNRIWYMGGLVGVYGVDKSDQEALDFAKKEMFSLFQKVNCEATEWAVLPVDRAEPKAESGFLPDGPQVASGASNFLFTWPTKMTFAPALGIDVEKWVKDQGSFKTLSQSETPSWIVPSVGANPWDEIEWATDRLKATAY